MLALRTQRSMVVTGLVSICCGVFNAWSSYSATVSRGAPNPYATGIAHADAAISGLAVTPFAGLSHHLVLGRLLLGEPLIWIGVALVLAPTALRRLTRERRPQNHAQYAGYSYVECPNCRQPVRATERCCPHCGESTGHLWGTEAAPYLRRQASRR